MPSLADAPRISPALERAVARTRLAPWRVRAVTDAAQRRAIRDAHLPHWHDYLRESGGTRVLAAGGASATARALRAADAMAEALHELPLHLVVLARPDGPLRRGTLGALLEALRDEGVDGALVPLAVRAGDELRTALALTEDVAVAGLIAARPRR